MNEAARKRSDTDDLDLLTGLNENFIRSVAQSDVGWFDANLTGDFLNSNADGSLSDRAQFLDQIAKPCAVSALRAEDVRIRILGDTAIIHARTVYQKPDGQQGAGRYTDVYRREHGQWRCVAAHVTRG